MQELENTEMSRKCHLEALGSYCSFQLSPTVDGCCGLAQESAQQRGREGGEAQRALPLSWLNYFLLTDPEEGGVFAFR